MAVSKWYELTNWSSDNSNGGGYSWSNPGNAATPDLALATAAATEATAIPSDYLKGLLVAGWDATGITDFNSVEVEITTQIDQSGANDGTVSITRLSLVIGGTVQTEDISGDYSPAYADGVLEAFTVRFDTDLPTPNESEASDFGLVLETDHNGGLPYNVSFGVDSIRIRFVYDDDPSPTKNTIELWANVELAVRNGTNRGRWVREFETRTNNVQARGVLYTQATPTRTHLPAGVVYLRNVGNGTVIYGPFNGSTFVEFGYLHQGEVALMRLKSGVEFGCYGNTAVQFVVIGDQ